jgi:hypothetical protein
MSTCSQSHKYSLLDRSNYRERTYDPNSAPYSPDAAGLNAVDSSISNAESGRVYAQDPFVHYRAFLRTNVSSAWGVNDNRDTHHAVSLSAQSNQYCGDRQQFPVRPVPYNVAAHLMNPSNGVPLSTIIEQGSYSTLNSHGSPPNIDRYPPAKANDNVSPNQHPHRGSRSSYEIALHKIEEDNQHEQHVCKNIHSHVQPEDDRGVFDKQCFAAMPIRSSPCDRQLSEGFPTPDIDNDLASKGLKGIMRGVLHNVRASRRDGQWSSMINTPACNSRGGRLDTKEDSSQPQRRISENHMSSLDMNRPRHDSLLSSSSPLPHDLSRFETRNGTSLSINTDTEHTTPQYPHILHLPPTVSEFPRNLGSSPLFLLPQETSSSPGEHAPSTIPHDVARETSSAGPYALSRRSRDDVSACYTFDGVLLYGSNAPSLKEYDREREASICSTVSTTYSGPVLGIDLDLQQEHAHTLAARRSPMPAWFSPRQISGFSIPTQRSKNDSAILPQSITSSALPALLPLAAASGIVRPNHATPKLSFVTPSGNLIQTENGSSPTTSSILPHHSKSSPTAVYNKIFSDPVCEPPVRPALIPMTTPPTTRSSLPAHLQHHHNYQHPAHSHINPQTPIRSFEIRTDGVSVKGCGGMVRMKSLQPHSGVKRPKGEKHSDAGKKYNHWSWCTTSKLEIHSCMRRLSLRVQNAKPIGRAKGTGTGAFGKTQKPRRSFQGTLGPLAGHALKLCACQSDILEDDSDSGTHTGLRKGHKNRPLEREYNVSHATRGGKVQALCVHH